MRATIRDIASEAGVTDRTVSNVLAGKTHGTRSDAKARAIRIHNIADRLGYKPNGAARAIRGGRFNALGLLLSTTEHRSATPTGLIDGIHERCTAHKQHFNIAKLPDDQLTDDRYMPKVLREQAVDGLLINYTSEIPDPMLGLIHDLAIPSIWVNSKQRSDCVRPNDEAAGVTATEALLKAGHRQIAYLDFWPIWHYSSTDRRVGYEAAMLQAGLTPQVCAKPVIHPERRQAVAAMLRQPDRPTAIVCYGASEATAVIMAVYETGLKPGRDLSVIALTDARSILVAEGVAWLAVPELEIGQCAVDMLMSKIGGQVSEVPAQVISFSPIGGEVRPPAGYQMGNL